MPRCGGPPRHWCRVAAAAAPHNHVCRQSTASLAYQRCRRHLCTDGKINPRTIVEVGITHPDLVELAVGEKHKGMGEMQASEIAARSRGRMAPTDISNPEYFHKVVDCQWACPTHTPVPEYIRLIAQRRYAAAYMLNWESNVFPGILGRVCDRPCEPACRRGRVEEKPVAICRLKRVAADYKGEIDAFMPEIPKQKNGKRIALIGAGPASLTVARDLMPLGYTCVLFEKDRKGGGLMRTNIPSFRLPAGVLDEEIDRIVAFGVEMRFGQEIKSLASLTQGRLRRRLHRHRRAQGQGPRHPRPQGSGCQHPHRHRLADLGRLRARAHRRQARGRDRRRQHRHGLLPHGAAARRHERHRHRALAAPGDEGVGLGDRGRRARGHPDPRQSRAQGLHRREGPPDRRALPEDEGGRHRQGRPAQARAHRRGGRHRVRRRADGDRPGERLPLDRARHRPRVRRMGTCRRSTRSP